eukprot:CAMPEP_0201667618 /NCGR_PEP_ID=MMETSP0494-20130426/15863_1 /ASSEMBLY_ACC=CAM_ASM_000839 /TAXON_ID=420259 /ORGANISM="Thalassiosira gravida, Strain GMp14c1" /LENGTH=352 /DNA_ID=CAMNT_0048147667 /DNA_START=43 /DNA_END=1101 /DNA_ORIENTATION=+
MTPYVPSSFNSSRDNCNDPPVKCINQEEVIFSLTERLRERDNEIRHLRQQKNELENQLTLRGNPIKLDAAYEDLLAHLKRREEEYRSDSKKESDIHRELEVENSRLKDEVNSSRKLLDEQEQSLSIIEKETNDDLDLMRGRLNDVMGDNEEKNRQVMMLKNMVEGLSIESDQFSKRRNEDNSLLSRLGERIETYRRDQHEGEVANEELQTKMDTMLVVLKEKEVEILEMERYRNVREAELSDEIERMRRCHNDFVDSQRVALTDREEEIHLLYRQCEKYEDIIDGAEYVTHGQRADLEEKKREVEELSMAIEKVQNTGLFGQLDNMCSTTSSFVRKTLSDSVQLSQSKSRSK